MNKIIAICVAIIIAFLYHVVVISGARDAAGNVVEKVPMTSVDKACKQSKDICNEL